MSKDHLLKLLCSVYTQEISADQAFDELEDLIDRIKRLEETCDESLDELEDLTDRIDRLCLAGDALLSSSHCIDYHEKVAEWTKAKEDKP